MFVRRSRAVWQGNLKEGKGRMSPGGRELEFAFSAGTRFGDEPGSNPEELIGAAHAGCFSMALAAVLAGAGYAPREIATEARVSIDRVADGFAIQRSDLVTEADVPGIDEATFVKFAEDAKKGCPVSKALKGVEITLQARLKAKA
jgi:lipoyl-dependent peroxiredoxin